MTKRREETKVELLIVDDEETALQAVREKVRWSELDFRNVYSTANIAEAKKILTENSINILLCDIEMPMCSGLELVEWVNVNKPDICCIFMTCHAEFSYARKALQLGSFEYILKPLDFGYLTKVLGMACERVKLQLRTRLAVDCWENGQAASRKQFWRELLQGDIKSDEGSVKDYLLKKRLSIAADRLFLPVFVRPGLFPNDVSVQDRNLLHFALRNIVRDIFRTEDTKYEAEIPKEDGALIILSAGNGTLCGERKPDIRAVCQSMHEADERYLHMKICCYVGEWGKISDIPEAVEEIRRLDIHSPYQSEEDVKWMVYIREALLDFERGERETECRSLVWRVAQYIKENLQEELTVEMLAKQVHLNADYLNRIFKREIGMPISRYVIEQKMERAKWLLGHTDWKIGEVALSVGYCNYSSFTRSFVKAAGISPQEYKKQNKSE